MTGRRETVGVLDALSAGSFVWVIVGPMSNDDVSTILPRLRAIAERGPLNRVGLQPEEDSLAWEFDPEITDRYLAAPADADVTDPSAALTSLLSRKPGAPIVATFQDGYLLIGLDHGIGDGGVMIELMAALGAQSPPAGGFVDPVPPATTNTALMSVLRNAVVSEPLAISKDIGAMTSGAIQGALGRLSERLTSGADTDDAPPLRRQRVDPSSGTTRVAAAWAGSTPGYLHELKAWRDVEAPGASLSSLMFYCIWRGLREYGVHVMDDVNILVDLRRYLPKDAGTLGNLAGIATIALPDCAIRPGAFGEAVRAELESTRLLARTTAAATIRRMGAHRSLRGIGEPAHGRPRLILSDVTRLPASAKLSWRQDGQKIFAVALPPGSSQHISVCMTNAGGTIQFAATFSPDIADPDRVRAGLARALTIPTDSIASEERVG